MSLKELSYEQIDRARDLKAQNESWKTIGQRLGVSALTVRAALNPDWYLKLNEKRRSKDKRQSMGLQRISERFLPEPVARVFVPNDILMERDRRLAIPHRDFTSEWMGDPRPGYSALDKKQGVFK